MYDIIIITIIIIIIYYLYTEYLQLYKDNGRIHPITGHEGPVGEQRYNSTLSLTSALDEAGQRHAPAALFRERDTELIV
jgi:hypothetical protein